MGKDGKKDLHRELAERIYEMDTEIYAETGSEMGKVFPGLKHVSEKEIIKEFAKQDTDKLRKEMILIRNMLHTLSEGKRREQLTEKYEALMQDVKAYMQDEDRVREQISRDFTDDKFGLMHKRGGDRIVICIARQCGAGGHEIGMRLAKRLGISFYDKEIMDRLVAQMDDKFPGIRGKDILYIKQSRIIERLARSEDCVIVGRSCGHVLMLHNIPRFSVFVGAPIENRIRRKILLTGQNRKSVEDMIRRTDKERKSNYNYYTGKKWGNPGDFDICINSACYGIEGTVDLLEKLVQIALKKEEE